MPTLLRAGCLALLLAAASWAGWASARARLTEADWARPQPFPPGSAVHVTDQAPFGGTDQKRLRNFLFARENRVRSQPDPATGITSLPEGTELLFLGADAEMAWVQDASGNRFWVATRSLALPAPPP